MRYINILPIAMLCALCTACSSDNDDRDMQPPVISTDGIVANPVDCQVYHRGDTIPFAYVFTDDHELGNFQIEVHSNADHHNHAGAAGACQFDEDSEPVNPWHYNPDTPFTIPEGLKHYEARMLIAIPDSVDTGDYHFSIRLYDRVGWSAHLPISIKIAE